MVWSVRSSNVRPGGRPDRQCRDFSGEGRESGPGLFAEGGNDRGRVQRNRSLNSLRGGGFELDVVDPDRAGAGEIEGGFEGERIGGNLGRRLDELPIGFWGK